MEQRQQRIRIETKKIFIAMKKVCKWTLILAALFSLSMSIISCQDDSGTDGKEGEKLAKEENAKEKFWGVVSPLTGLYDHSAPYEDLTFEPTIGSPDESDPQTRIVATNSPALAAQRFAEIIGADTGIDENTQSYTYDDPDVGTLTYNRVSDGTAWATVDVSIKQLPHLTKIIYRSASQGNTNASFSGSAYYRFGDVIKRQVQRNARTSDGTATAEQPYTEYWICVRPSFSQEGKGDSHWISVSPPTDDHIFAYTSKTTNKSYYLPDNLGSNKEHAQNFAELLYAISYPEQWWYNINENSGVSIFGNPTGLPIFHDFSKSNLKYHNQHFWQKVKNAWFARNIIGNIFFLSKDDYPENFVTKGIHLLYDKCSWNTTWSNGPTLYEAYYTNGEGVKSNMHNAKYYTVKTNLINKSDPTQNLLFNTYEMSRSASIALNHPKFFGDNDDYYILRHATGEQLNGGSYDPKQPIRNGGFEDHYTYNQYYEILDLTQDPEVAIDPTIPIVNNDVTKQRITDFTGLSYYNFGDVYTDEEGSKWFCVYNSGTDYFDKSPYSYFVTFDNIRYDGDQRRASNLPARDVAIRCAYALASWNSQTNLSGTRWKMALDNIRKHTNADVDAMFHTTWNGEDVRGVITSACVAYNGTTPNEQDLLRFAFNETDDYSYGNITIDVWQHYPNEAISDRQPRTFSQRNILLVDIADQTLVNQHAEDRNVRRPLQYPKALKSTVARYPRTTADRRALDVTNYFYDPAKWNIANNWTTGEIPTSMWNEPILFFRATKVYDRGIAEHATISVDNVKLTEVEKVDWVGDEDNDYGMNLDSFLMAWGENWKSYVFETRRDGVPNWRTDTTIK